MLWSLMVFFLTQKPTQYLKQYSNDPYTILTTLYNIDIIVYILETGSAIGT